MDREAYMEEGQGYEIIQPGTGDLVEGDTVSTEDKMYQDSVCTIRRELDHIRQSFLTVGWHLKYIKDMGLYRKDGYASIYEFAADRFQMQQSSVSRYINLCERFSEGHGSPRLDRKYEGFDYSQLSEMLPMKPEELGKVTSDMTVRDIRKLKKEGKAGKKAREGMPGEGPGHPVGDGAGEGMAPHTDEVQAAAAADGKKQKGKPWAGDAGSQRQWLGDVEAWGLWYEDPNIQARYYKFDFPDGSRLVAVKYRYTCPPYMKDQPERYSRQIGADGSYNGEPVYHMVYSDNFWGMFPDECRKKYSKYYLHEGVWPDELVAFLDWLREWEENERYWRTVEFDPGHLEEKEDKPEGFLKRKYIAFFEKKGYIPRYFNAKNCVEIRGDGLAPTITTSSGSFTGAGAIVTFDLWHNIQLVLNNKIMDAGEQKNEIGRLIRIASREEVELAGRKFDHISSLWKDAGGLVGDEGLDEKSFADAMDRLLQAADSDDRECMRMKYIRVRNLYEDIAWAEKMADRRKGEKEWENAVQAASPEEMECISRGFDKHTIWKACSSEWERDCRIWEEALGAERDGTVTGRARFRVKKLTEAECLRLMGVPCTEEDIREMKARGVKSSTLYDVAGEGVPAPMMKAFISMVTGK